MHYFFRESNLDQGSWETSSSITARCGGASQGAQTNESYGQYVQINLIKPGFVLSLVLRAIVSHTKRSRHAKFQPIRSNLENRYEIVI